MSVLSRMGFIKFLILLLRAATVVGSIFRWSEIKKERVNQYKKLKIIDEKTAAVK